MKIGDKFKIPKERGCGHKGKIVWISEYQETIAVQCSKYHTEDPFTKKPYEKGGRENIVYLIDVS